MVDARFVYAEDIPHSRMPFYYQNADVCVIPSLYEENFSIVIPEAASCGCVVVTSNRGVLPEAVKGFGFAIDPTPEKFAEMIKTLKDELYLKKLRKKTIKYARKHFTSKNEEMIINEHLKSAV